ncbi:MAG: hypothetical protein KDK09_12450 [Rhodobacteraceae bacterium]|nr:hypothetical protein [Paracoccaceae bacterium]
MRAVIHIGMPKTGSSSIQEFLKLNREALLSRGIRYAPLNPAFGSQFELAATGVVGAGQTIRDAHSRLILQLPTPQAEAAYVDRYRQFLDDGLAHWTEDLFIASSEHIQPWLHQAAMMQALDRFLTARFTDVRYVIYLRDQAELMISSWSERIRRGETLDFDTHLDGRLKALNFNWIVTKWEEAVGADRLDVRLLTRDALVQGDLIHDFCAVMGTPRAGLAEPARMNTALSTQEAAVRRRVNRWLPVRRRNGRFSPLHYGLVRALMLVRRGVLTPLTLPPEARTRIAQHFARSNERLRARRFPDRTSLF